MIGIYKITKISNGKSYIGQSNDIERRFQEHKTKKDIPIEVAI
jgi:predicted GIY-YIG superfamily endonuclease